ncbi:MAG: hypothetical protein H0X43_11390 [Nitrosospira sp.]|nr:hypothetical protein [Nitrosospira sp.]
MNENTGKDRDPLDEIIREVAIRHGYAIGRDDPILMTYTINQQVMEAAARIQHTVLEKHLRDMEEMAARLEDQAAGQLNRVLREAMESVRLAMRQEAENLFSQQRRQGEALNRQMMQDFLQWQRLAGFSTLISLLALAAAVTLLWSVG